MSPIAQKETPAIMIMIAVRYCLVDKWGDALVHLKTVAEKLNNKKAYKLLQTVSDVVYYAGNMIPYLPPGGVLVSIQREGSTDFISKDELVGELVDAKTKIVTALLYMMEEVDMDMPSFVDGIKNLH